jgi:hypothetical protein
MDQPPVFILTIPKNLSTKTTQASILTWQKKNFEVHLVYGIERSHDTSKIVMDSWKQFFTSELKGDYPNGIIIAEDDSYLLKSWKQLYKKFNMKYINWFGYQNIIITKNEDIIVGAQAIYIPKQLIESYKQQLLNAKSIHFDRWNSRQDIYLPFNHKEAVLELERISLTTGRLRKGLKLN